MQIVAVGGGKAHRGQLIALCGFYEVSQLGAELMGNASALDILCATSAVISALSSPERTSEVFRRLQRIVTRDRACLPHLGILAVPDHGMSVLISGTVQFEPIGITPGLRVHRIIQS